MLTSSAIKAHARTLGFDVCGIAPATALPELARLHDWLARGHDGEMRTWPASAEVRTDIQRFLPGARRSSSPAPTTGPARRRRPAASPRRGWRATRTARTITWSWPSGSTPCWPGCEADGEPFEAAPFVDKHWVQERVFAAYAGLGGSASTRWSSTATSDRGCCWPASRPRCRSNPTGWSTTSVVPARCASMPVRPARSSPPREVDATGLSQLPDHRARRAGAGARPRRGRRSPLRL